MKSVGRVAYSHQQKLENSTMLLVVAMVVGLEIHATVSARITVRAGSDRFNAV
jgi:hypothetical protein